MEITFIARLNENRTTNNVVEMKISTKSPNFSSVESSFFGVYDEWILFRSKFSAENFIVKHWRELLYAFI